MIEITRAKKILEWAQLRYNHDSHECYHGKRIIQKECLNSFYEGFAYLRALEDSLALNPYTCYYDQYLVRIMALAMYAESLWAAEAKLYRASAETSSLEPIDAVKLQVIKNKMAGQLGYKLLDQGALKFEQERDAKQCKETLFLSFLTYPDL